MWTLPMADRLPAWRAAASEEADSNGIAKKRQRQFIQLKKKERNKQGQEEKERKSCITP